MFENRAGRVLGAEGGEVGTVYLEEEELRRRSTPRWWGVLGGWVVEPAIHQHYWSSDGSIYEDAIVYGEGLRRSVGLWKASQVEVDGVIRPVRWATIAESEEVRAWMEGRAQD